VKNNTEKTWGKNVESDAKYSKGRLKRYIALQIERLKPHPG
jgi:hypothetical protein